MAGKYYVIESPGRNSSDDAWPLEVHSGPHPSIAAAEKAIVSEAEKSLFNGSELKEGIDEEWGSDMLICELRYIVRPITEVKAKIRLKHVK